MPFVKMIRKIGRLGQGFVKDRHGVVSVEIAVVAVVLSAMSVAIVDLSLGFSHKSEMENAVRAGAQYALVRKPSLDPSADEQEALISITNIRNAVVESATFLGADPGTPDLDVSVFCECPDTTPVSCLAEPGVPSPCPDLITLLNITLNQSYAPILSYPGIPSPINLRSTNTIRLN